VLYIAVLAINEQIVLPDVTEISLTGVVSLLKQLFALTAQFTICLLRNEFDVTPSVLLFT
jgi:hypothetical protein